MRRVHPSRRLLRKLLRMAQDEVSTTLPILTRRAKSVRAPNSCLVAGEDDDKASRRISEIQKFRLPTEANQFTDSRRPVPQRGVRTSRTRGGMRWTRAVHVTNGADADGEVVWF